MLNLFPIQKKHYQRVSNYSLPARPENNPRFVYVGRNLGRKPENLENYLKGGWKYSEQRRQEILALFKKPSSIRRSLYPDCNKLFNNLFPPLELLKNE